MRVARFQVITDGNVGEHFYWIKDTESKKWNLPERATAVNFDSLELAHEVADRLNKAWRRFLRNPY